VKATFGSYAVVLGVAYPVAVCVVTVIVGGLYIRETKDHRIDSNEHPMQH
jgi:hypothetical protein